jgi:hypothetical protein
MNWTPIVGRGFTAADFDAYVKALSFAAWCPSLLVVHNTASPTFAQWHQVAGASRMRGFQDYYSSPPPNGPADGPWSAGPHLFVADDLIWAFTPLTSPGVHSPSWNAISWGVETTGDWSKEPVPAALMENLVSALTTLCQAANLDPAIALRWHLDDPLTTHKGCPGQNLQKPDLIQRVQTRLSPLVCS